MKRSYYRHFLLLLLFPFFLSSISAQDLTGIWKGYFISDEGEYYKLEFQVAQNGAFGVTGVSYSYLDVRFYGKATMTGSFIKSSSSFKIKEIKTVEVKSLLGGATCIMNYNFLYSKSGKEEFLEGSYLGKYEPPYQQNPPGKWGDCGGGKVFLRKVRTTDFYVEPFLRNKIKNIPVIVNEAPRRNDSAKNKPVVTTNPPAKNNNQPANKPTVKNTNPPVTKPIVKKTNPATQPNTKNNIPPVTRPITKTNTPTSIKPNIDTTLKIKPTVIATPDVLKTRTNELVKILTVSSPEVIVKLYDNGEIDDDTVSIYLDKKMVLGSKRLTASPLTVKFRIDEDDSEHELVMVAENLGRIPPNTSLMVVEAGEQRFNVYITSTEQKNAVVRFKYEKPE